MLALLIYISRHPYAIGVIMMFGHIYIDRITLYYVIDVYIICKLCKLQIVVRADIGLISSFSDYTSEIREI